MRSGIRPWWALALLLWAGGATAAEPVTLAEVRAEHREERLPLTGTITARRGATRRSCAHLIVLEHVEERIRVIGAVESELGSAGWRHGHPEGPKRKDGVCGCALAARQKYAPLHKRRRAGYRQRPAGH